MKFPSLWRGNAFSVFWVIPIFLLCLVGGCLVVAWILGDTTDYVNKEKGFQITYPTDWVIKENPVPSQSSSVVGFLSPKESDNDKFLENVNIVVMDLSADPMDLKALVARAVDQLSGTFKDIKILENQPITVGPLHGQKLVYAAKENSPLKIMTVLFVEDKKSYQIFYTAAFDKFDAYLPLVNAMIASFKLL